MELIDPGKAAFGEAVGFLTHVFEGILSSE